MSVCGVHACMSRVLIHVLYLAMVDVVISVV